MTAPASSPRPRITYCTNVHPATRWADVGRTLRDYVLEVKRSFSPDAPFPVGLWLSNEVAWGPDGGVVAAFGSWCRNHDLFITTLNGFPFGAFHGGPVKCDVYRPDWRSPDRSAYTCRLFDLLAVWLPDGVTGSVSTVPAGWGRDVGAGDLPVVRARLLETLQHVDRLRQRTGKDLVLALEPEPGCVVETTDDLIRFSEALELPSELQDAFGVCYDCCHHAVEFEDPTVSLGQLQEAGIRLAKVHVSSAVCCHDPDPDALARFDEPVYLHQVVVAGPTGDLRRYSDLGDALREEGGRPGEWRIHYHLPIFYGGSDGWGTTRGFLEKVLKTVPADTLLEVETYTWDVLPEALKAPSLVASIARELSWVRSRLDAAHRRS